MPRFHERPNYVRPPSQPRRRKPAMLAAPFDDAPTAFDVLMALPPQTRRTILGAALALPLVGRPAAARQPDPAVAAVEALKAALAVYDEACRLVDEIAAQHEGRIITPEDHAAYERAVEAYDKAREAMVETVPTSAQGIRAMLHYHIKHDCFADPETTATLESILASPVLADGAGAKSV